MGWLGKQGEFSPQSSEPGIHGSNVMKIWFIPKTQGGARQRVCTTEDALCRPSAKLRAGASLTAFADAAQLRAGGGAGQDGLRTAPRPGGQQQFSSQSWNGVMPQRRRRRSAQQWFSKWGPPRRGSCKQLGTCKKCTFSGLGCSGCGACWTKPSRGFRRALEFAKPAFSHRGDSQGPAAEQTRV